MQRGIFLIAACLVAIQVHGQGCSDAGICTMGALKQQNERSSDSFRHKLTMLAAAGWGDDHVFVFSPAVQYSFKTGHEIEVQAKVNLNYASGNLGTSVGAGDIILDVVKTIPIVKQLTIAFAGGLKVPLSDGNLKRKGLPLPMQYQSSLGTFDAVASVALYAGRWSLTAGYQQPLSGDNGSRFDPAQWQYGLADVYPESNRFRRSADIIAKAGYRLQYNRRWAFTPGMLGIYHVKEDSYYDVMTGQVAPLKGSKGLTLNLVFNAVYSGAKWSAGLTVGRPVVVRDIRPDGLTRSIVLLPEVSFKL